VAGRAPVGAIGRFDWVAAKSARFGQDTTAIHGVALSPVELSFESNLHRRQSFG
jgi:hypothetical protein